MSDDFSKVSADRNRITMDEAWERSYWANAFGVTEEQLMAAVKVVGLQVPALRKELDKSLGI